MIELHGLTQHQVELLDVIWSIETMPEVEAWVETLSNDDQMECHSLIELIAIEILDSQIRMSVKFPEATTVINRIMGL